IQVSALLGPDHRRAVAGLPELNRGERDRDPYAVPVHLVAVHDALAWHDVVVESVVPEDGAFACDSETLPAAGPEVELRRLRVGGSLDILGAPGGPGLLGSECSEHRGRRRRVGALDRERVVDDRTLGHRILLTWQWQKAELIPADR